MAGDHFMFGGNIDVELLGFGLCGSMIATSQNYFAINATADLGIFGEVLFLGTYSGGDLTVRATVLNPLQGVIDAIKNALQSLIPGGWFSSNVDLFPFSINYVTVVYESATPSLRIYVSLNLIGSTVNFDFPVPQRRLRRLEEAKPRWAPATHPGRLLQTESSTCVPAYGPWDFTAANLQEDIETQFDFDSMVAALGGMGKLKLNDTEPCTMDLQCNGQYCVPASCSGTLGDFLPCSGDTFTTTRACNGGSYTASQCSSCANPTNEWECCQPSDVPPSPPLPAAITHSHSPHSHNPHSHTPDFHQHNPHSHNPASPSPSPPEAQDTSGFGRRQ